jgi:hypothetical protein
MLCPGRCLSGSAAVTTAKLGQLSRTLGYARPESIPGIVRRAEVWKGRDPMVDLHIRTLDAVLTTRLNAADKVHILRYLGQTGRMRDL